MNECPKIKKHKNKSSICFLPKFTKINRSKNIQICFVMLVLFCHSLKPWWWDIYKAENFVFSPVSSLHLWRLSNPVYLAQVGIHNDRLVPNTGVKTANFHNEFVFSAPEPQAQVHYCDRALSVVRPWSVHRPSVVNFLHFRLLLWNHWKEFNETWQEARSQRPLQSLCFSDWSEKQDCHPGFWLAETFSTSPLKPLNRIQGNFTGSKISTSSSKLVFFGQIRKWRWQSWPLIGWDIFDFSSDTPERNSTKLDWMQDLNVLYQVGVFGPIGKTRWPSWPLIGWDIFDYLLWNRWTEFNETWQEAISQRPLPSFFFSGRSKKKCCPGFWLA